MLDFLQTAAGKVPAPRELRGHVVRLSRLRGDILNLGGT